MATLTVYPDTYPGSTTVNGNTWQSGTSKTWANLRGAVGNNSDNDFGVEEIYLEASTTSNQWIELDRFIALFDTSALPVGVTINSAVLSLYGNEKLDGGLTKQALHICSSSPASNTVIVNTDYQQLGSTSFGNISFDSFAVGSYNDITLNASGIANIVPGGISKFGARSAADINNSPPTWKSGDYSGLVFESSSTGNGPKLVIDYTPAAPTVTTEAVTNIASTTATGNGNVTNDGGGTITERGVCWNTSGTPTTSDSKATSTGTTGAYTVSMTGLSGTTLYYARAYAINSTGTSYGDSVSFTTAGLTNPANVYSSDNTYATASATSGDISIQLSGDAGATYSTALTKTFTGSESTLTYGNGSTELWGLTWMGSNVTNTNFRLKVNVGSVYQVYKTFGFSPGATVTLTGIEVKVEAKWDGSTTSIDQILAKIYYGTSTVPVQTGSLAYDTTKLQLSAYNGSSWDAIAIGTIPVKASGTEVNTGTDDAKFVTAKAIADSTILRSNLTGDVTSSGVATTLVGVTTSNLTTFSNPYKFAVYKNTGMTLGTSATIFTYDTEEFDTNNNYDAVTNHNYTAPVNGFYFFKASMIVSDPSTSTVIAMDLFKNGSQFKRLWRTNTPSASQVIGGDSFISLSANDTVDIRIVTVTHSITSAGGAIADYFMGFLVCKT